MVATGHRMRWLVVFFVFALVVGCSGGDAQDPNSPSGRSPGSPGEPGVYVAVGASETVGVGAADPAAEAWPTLFHDLSVAGADYVNVGVSGATVGDALRTQVPRALAAGPDLVTVWLAVNDIIKLVPVRTYERQPERLVRRLRRGARAEVLVANAPDLWRLPAYQACLPGAEVTDVACLLPLVPGERQVRATVRDFNDAIERVVRSEGAQLVDLSRVDDLTGLIGQDGFHPSSAGHREVAAAFAAALKRAQRGERRAHLSPDLARPILSHTQSRP